MFKELFEGNLKSSISKLQKKYKKEIEDYDCPIIISSGDYKGEDFIKIYGNCSSAVQTMKDKMKKDGYKLRDMVIGDMGASMTLYFYKK